MVGLFLPGSPGFKGCQFFNVGFSHSGQNEAAVLKRVGESLGSVGELVSEPNFAFSAVQRAGVYPPTVSFLDLAIEVAFESLDAVLLHRVSLRPHMLLRRAVQCLGPFM